MDFWRNYDLRGRKTKLERAFRCEALRSAEDFPVAVSGNYSTFNQKPRSAAYYEDPAFMVKFQEDSFAKYMANVEDDQVPYFMPYFGTGVLATAFGCVYKPSTGEGDDPYINGPVVHTIEDAAKLKMPDPYRDGILPKVLHFMEYARNHSDLPVGPTDLNSPFSTMLQICGFENISCWIYDEPALIHDMMSLITEAFINWVKVQKEYAGEPMDASNGLQGIWSPKGVGVWISDDDLTNVNAETYAEFVVPYYSKLFPLFSGGHLHYCGPGNQQLENFKKITGLRVINNSPMADMDAFAVLVKERPRGVAIEIHGKVQDPYDYYKKLFEKITDFSGLILKPFVPDINYQTINGVRTGVEWDRFEVAREVIKAARTAVTERLAVLSKAS
jgi:uroporphyrinogen-III decarboxylase